MTNQSSNNGGFTLIELTLALGIFSIMLIILIGFYSNITGTQRRDLAEQKIVSNVRSSLELISREIRTSYGSALVAPDALGEGVIIRNQNELCVYFRFREATIERAEAVSATDICTPNLFTASIFAKLTSGDTIIENGHFTIIPARVGESALESQGLVTITAAVKSRDTNLVPIPLQTSVSTQQVIPYVKESL